MKIRFSFDEIKDISLISITNPNQENDTEINIQKDYLNEKLYCLMNSVDSVLNCKYIGEEGRLSRYHYHVEGDESYNLFVTIDTYGNKQRKAHMQIEIEYDENGEDGYNMELELIKKQIIKTMKKDWNLCTWLRDEQSDKLSIELYSGIAIAENMLREFVGRVLLFKYGPNWKNKMGMVKYTDKIIELPSEMKNKLNVFSSVDWSLMSVTIETIEAIITDAVIYKEPVSLSSSDYNALYRLVKEKKDSSIVFARLNECFTEKERVWNAFEKYILDTDGFKNEMTAFRKNRNHIAHNKLVTKAVYDTIKQETNTFKKTLGDAIYAFEDTEKSNEERISWEEYDDDINTMNEEEYLRYILNSEAGAEILDREDIYEKFYYSILNLYDEIYDEYHYDFNYIISAFNEPVDKGESVVFEIKNTDGKKIASVSVDVFIDDKMGEKSTMELLLSIDEKTNRCGTVVFTNGKGHIDSEGISQLDKSSIYKDRDIIRLKKRICDYLNKSYF